MTVRMLTSAHATTSLVLVRTVEMFARVTLFSVFAAAVVCTGSSFSLGPGVVPSREP